MKSISKQISVSLLLKSEVGQISENELAGTEQVFLKDISALNKFYNTKAYARFHNDSPSVKALFFSKRVLNTRFSFIHELFYHIQFVLLNQKSNILIGYSAPLLALLSNKKTVVFLHNNHPFPLYKKFKRKYQKATYVFCSEALKSEVFKKNEVNLPKTFILHNSIDSNVFNCDHKLVVDAKNSSKLKILFCSAWTQEKGLNVLLEAILLLPKTLRQKICLTISSSPKLWYSDNQELRKAYVEKSLDLLEKIKNVSLLNGVKHSELSKLYFQNDFTAFPSIWNEPFGLVCLESIACGTKVISFSNPSTSEILDKDNSILVSKKSALALKDCLVKLIKNHKVKKKNKRSLLTKKNSLMIDDKRISRFKEIINQIVIEDISK